jgi:hypothetical protein
MFSNVYGASWYRRSPLVGILRAASTVSREQPAQSGEFLHQTCPQLERLSLPRRRKCPSYAVDGHLLHLSGDCDCDLRRTPPKLLLRSCGFPFVARSCLWRSGLGGCAELGAARRGARVLVERVM